MAHQPDPVRPATSDPATPPPPYPEGTSSEQIRRDIRRTRAEMDQTVDTLQERLRPRHLIDDLLDMFRSSGGGDAVSGAKESFKDAGYKVVDKLKQHPMPAALIGAGLVWLLFEDDGRADVHSYQPRKWDVPEHSGSYVDARTGRPYEESYGARAGAGAGAGDASVQRQDPSMAEQAKDSLSGAAQSIGEGTRAVGEKVGQWTQSARDTASSAAHGARAYSRSASEQISRGYEKSRHSIERGMEEYPLAIGAAAMALGVLTGLCLPRTRTEDRLMGDSADQVKDRAREAGREVVERGKDVARSASDEAQRQGLHPGTVTEKVKRVAEDVKDAAAESAKREGLDTDSLAHKGQQVAERAKESAQEQAHKSQQKPRDSYPA